MQLAPFVAPLLGLIGHAGEPLFDSRELTDNAPVGASYGTYADLRLAFWPSMGLKPGIFMTVGMSEKRAARFYRVPDRVVHPA